MGFDRIQMDVAKQDKAAASIDIDELGLITPFEQMSRGSQYLVAVAGVSHRDVLHKVSERALSNLEQGAQMIRHPAERVNANSKAMGDFGNDVIHRVSVCSTAKQNFAMVAAKNDMVVLPFPSVITVPGT
jgi:hypothetical protein